MQFKEAKQRSLEILVDPVMARRMLDTSIGNRRLRGWWVDLLCRMILSGEWKLTHQGIAFDVNGNLRDGHHRLTAIISSGVACRVWVTLGISLESAKAIDQGVVRSMADVLGMDKRVIEPIRFAAKMVQSFNKVMVGDLERILETGLHDAIAYLIEHCGSTKAYYTSAPMRLAAALRIMDGSPASHVVSVYRSLATFNVHDMCPVALALVRQVDDRKAVSTHSLDVLARGLKVFEYERRDITKIQITDAERSAASAYVKHIIGSKLKEAA